MLLIPLSKAAPQLPRPAALATAARCSVDSRVHGTTFKMSRISCRFYEQKFPEVDDVVMVKVKSIAEMGAYVELVE